MTKVMERVLFLGGARAGKTSLISALSGNQWRNDYVSTTNTNITSFSKEMKTWEVLDTSSEKSSLALRLADIVVIAVDLSLPMPIDTIDSYLRQVKAICGKDFKGCILVGCKNDGQDVPGLESFNNYVLPECFHAKKYLTSAKENTGLDDLLAGFSEVAVEAEINALKKAQAQAEAQVLAKECLDNSIDDFLTNAQKTLSSKDYQKLCTLTNDLTTTLSSQFRSPDNKSRAVDKYKLESKQIIGGHSPLIKGLTIVVIVALAGILAAGIGFGIGFAAGLWTGPGAFLTGLLNGSGFAVGVMAMTGAAMTGALVGASYSAFFKPNPLKPLLNDVVDNAKLMQSI